MTEGERQAFLDAAMKAAEEAGHPWAEYAACEAALESNWGRSMLARKANNLLGQKQGSKFPLPYPCCNLQTEEVRPQGHPGQGRPLTGGRVMEQAVWPVFPDWKTCFAERMALLKRLPSRYGAALAATSGEEFVRQVSLSWATDPERGGKVLAIHRQYFEQPPEIVGSLELT